MFESIVEYTDRYKLYKENLSPITLYDELVKPIEYLMSLSGKHLRPTAFLVAYDTFQNDIDDSALKVAHAIELFHNFTLMHDDIMDDADLRRGKESTHKKFGVDSAILSGDAMMLQSIKDILNSQVENKLILVDFFINVGLQICEGQAMDMNFETKNQVTIDEYIEMIRLKTSVLFGACFYMGAIAGGASPIEALKLYNFGENVGIAFQIQDDILDIYGNTFKVGKRKAGDLYNKKKTIIYLTLKDKLNDSNARKLEEIYLSTGQAHSNEVSYIIDLLQEYNVRTDVEKVMLKYKDIAISSINKLNLPEANKKIYLDLASKLIVREF